MGRKKNGSFSFSMKTQHLSPQLRGKRTRGEKKKTRKPRNQRCDCKAFPCVMKDVLFVVVACCCCCCCFRFHPLGCLARVPLALCSQIMLFVCQCPISYPLCLPRFAQCRRAYTQRSYLSNGAHLRSSIQPSPHPIVCTAIVASLILG